MIHSSFVPASWAPAEVIARRAALRALLSIRRPSFRLVRAASSQGRSLLNAAERTLGGLSPVRYATANNRGLGGWPKYVSPSCSFSSKLLRALRNTCRIKIKIKI